MNFESVIKQHTMEAVEKKTLTLQDAESYVRMGLREASASDLRARCIDGRYPEGAAAVAMPGGDAGLLAVGLGAAHGLQAEGSQISNEAVRDAVFTVIGGKQNFNYHTDDHTFEKGGAARFDGCGHCRLLKANTDAYGLSPEQAEFFAKSLEEVSASGVQPDVLEGAHEERAVIVVEAKGTKSWALDSQVRLDGKTTTQAFVYEASLANKRFEALAAALEKASGVAKEQIAARMQEIAGKQLQQTAAALAKGLPTFSVAVEDSGAFSVKQVA